MISCCIAMGYTVCSHLLEHSLGRTSVKKTAKILVFWAICKLCCWYLTVETAVGREIGNFLAYAMLQKYSYLLVGPSREVFLGITNKIVWLYPAAILRSDILALGRNLASLTAQMWCPQLEQGWGSSLSCRSSLFAQFLGNSRRLEPLQPLLPLQPLSCCSGCGSKEGPGEENMDRDRAV